MACSNLQTQPPMPAEATQGIDALAELQSHGALTERRNSLRDRDILAISGSDGQAE